MDETVSRRSVLRATVGVAGIEGIHTTVAAARRDEPRTLAGPRTARTRPPGEPKGFARTWTATHVQASETTVKDVAVSMGDGDVFVVGETTTDQDRTNRRIWAGEFDADGARWTKTLRADGPSETPRIVPAGDHYLVFWNGTRDDTLKNRVTKIAPDGNIRWQRIVDTDFSQFRDVVRIDDGYLAITSRTAWELTSEFEVAASLEPPDPEGWELGRGTESIVPVSDGYVATGTVLNEEAEQAFWAVKFDGADGTVQWSNAYAFDEHVFGGTATAVGDDRVVIVGGYGGDVDDPIALLVGPDGELRWNQVPSVTGFASFDDVHVSAAGIRALGYFDRDPAIVTFDESGTVVDRWRDETGDRKLLPRVFDALGDGRYVVGGDVDVPDIDSKAVVMRLQPNDPPTPAVSVSPEAPNATASVTFDAGETTDSDTAVDRYEWDLEGDSEAEQTGETMTTRFDSEGTHEVAVRAVDEYGAVGKQVVSVSVGPNTAPSGSLSLSNESPRVGDEVTVRATQLSDAETSVASVSWEVDGERVDETGQELAVSFDTAGEHNVSAVLTDTGGKSTTVEASVSVEAPTTTATTTSGEADDSTASETTGASGDNDGGGESPVPGFGVGAAALAVSVVAALAPRFGDDEGS